jgi:hypothetical protein
MLYVLSFVPFVPFEGLASVQHVENTGLIKCASSSTPTRLRQPVQMDFCHSSMPVEIKRFEESLSWNLATSLKLLIRQTA